jgi:DNA-binding MarR family transcriptional regulator
MTPESTPDFVRAKGLPFLAHLLRRLADRMVADAGEFYVRQGVTAPARTASTLLLLREQGPQTVTDLAAKLRQSHPLAITWIRQLGKLGFVAQSTDPADRRRTVVSLTHSGEEEAERTRAALEQLGRAYEQLLADSGTALFDGLWRLDALTSDGALLRLLLRSSEEKPGSRR